jgi:tRNA-specific 2-thiouridylase
VVLVYEQDLRSTETIVDDVNWISGEVPEKEIRVKAKVRYRQKEQWATAYPLEDGKVRLVFDEPLRAITPGQAAVFYDGDEVLGGGTIIG